MRASRRRSKAWSTIRRQHAPLFLLTLFSIAPLLIVVIAVAGCVGQEAAQGAIVGNCANNGEEARWRWKECYKAAREPAKTSSRPLSDRHPAVGSTAIFAELQARGRIWRVPRRRRCRVSGTCCAGSAVIGLVLALGFLLVISLVVSAALAALGNGGRVFEGWDVFLEC